MREDDPTLLNLYERQANGDLLYTGKYLRASINGQSHSDPFDMSPLDDCAAVPEARPE
jgi:hypothetical protein